MNKLDIVQEVVAKRKRIGRKRDPLSQVQTRLFGIYLAFETLRKMPAKKEDQRELKQEMVRYFSVGLVSCLEGYFRFIIRRVIDHGSPYRENAAKLTDVRVDLDTITRMEVSRVSAGEIISHLVKLSSFEDINRHLTILLGTSYFASVGTMSIQRRSTTTFEQENPRAWETLSGLFQDRHIACHELNPQSPWKFARATEQWRIVINLIEANELLLRAMKIKPGPWRTTPGRLSFLFRHL
jgi:hypothetical protein